VKINGAPTLGPSLVTIAGKGWIRRCRTPTCLIRATTTTELVKVRRQSSPMIQGSATCRSGGGDSRNCSLTNLAILARKDG
jgi:hypothetical protein